MVEEGTRRAGAARSAAPVHRRPAALHPARRRAQGSRPARHDPGLPAADRRRPAGLRVRRPLRARRGRLPQREAADVPRRRAATSSRCFFHERAQELPRAMAANLEGAGVVDRTRAPLLDVDDLTKIFSQGGGSVHALARRLDRRSGRARRSASWASRAAARRRSRARCSASSRPRAARVSLDGRALAPTLAKRTGEDVRALQIVFQNPDSALNRRHTVRRILRRSLKRLAGITGKAADERIRMLSEAVRLPDRAVLQRPAQLSGGQKQRVAIARAFAGEPRLVVCDEPTSALDVSVQAAILNLLVELQAERETAYLFISHDLGVVRYLSDRIAVLYLGRLMELGTAEAVFAARTIRTPRRCSRRCRRSTASSASGSASRATSRAPPTRPRVRLPHALPAQDGRSARRRSRRSSRSSPRTTCVATSPSRSSGELRLGARRARRGRAPMRTACERRHTGAGRGRVARHPDVQPRARRGAHGRYRPRRTRYLRAASSAFIASSSRDPRSGRRNFGRCSSSSRCWIARTYNARSRRSASTAAIVRPGLERIAHERARLARRSRCARPSALDGAAAPRRDAERAADLPRQAEIAARPRRTAGATRARRRSRPTASRSAGRRAPAAGLRRRRPRSAAGVLRAVASSGLTAPVWAYARRASLALLGARTSRAPRRRRRATPSSTTSA